jgi:hypothetical protein
MWKNTLIAAAFALSLSACATQPAARPASADATAKIQPPPGCVGSTGTLIPVAAGTCAGFGNSYTRQDIDHTGQTSVAGALSVMDPSLSIRGVGR